MPSPQIFFNRNMRLLVWPAFGTWDAASGSRSGANELPPGLYAVDRPGLAHYTNSADLPGGFKDNQTGYGFFVPMYPLFATTRGQYGGRLGIHPDGKPPGTAGCIGIKNNSKSFYDAVYSVAGGRCADFAGYLRFLRKKCLWAIGLSAIFGAYYNVGATREND